MISVTLFQREIPPLEYLGLDIFCKKRLFQMLGQKFLFQEFSVMVKCMSLSTHAYRKFSCYVHKSKQLAEGEARTRNPWITNAVL